MLKKSLRWLAFSVAVLFLIDRGLPLLDPWRSTDDQWMAVFIVVGSSAFALLIAATALVKALLTFVLWRLGSGDIERGGRILDARMAARNARKRAT
jgi:hypothetical protein